MTKREEEYKRARDKLARLLDRNDPRLPVLFRQAEMSIPLSEGWREVDFLNARGAMLPIRRGGDLLMLVWDHPDAEDLLPHAHPFGTTFRVLRGELHLYVDGKPPVHLSAKDGPHEVGANEWHHATVTAGTLLITTYPSDVILQESLTNEPEEPIIADGANLRPALSDEPKSQ